MFTLLLSARARCMTWRVNFVRSKDAQKQLARTSLNVSMENEFNNKRDIALMSTVQKAKDTNDKETTVSLSIETISM